ncbi:cellulose-binding domain-containing protein [Paractinoplanes lichenicola]|uniref:Cellulose-binding domain-containing protein n=1 Tax=Paractinoplanes lichenicola TaxID=2802976 RepID=A0ABS1VYG2_9ACTN|nr:cellulose-binding domain-containing protein [Actinoplanes lichenicola]MBL7259495.1 cellulose-binding domain-containing protein [Actinoplanes lichenicola]
MKRRIAWSVACLMAVFCVVAVLRPAYAAVGCRVTYAVTNQWSGGFGASVTVANLGDALNGWTLTFAFPDAGQKVVQGWNGTFAQSGSTVSVTNASWNGSVASGGSISVGFNGSFTSANPVPTAFAVNGTTCTGSTPPPATTPPTTPPATPPTTTPPPTTPPAGNVWNPPSQLVQPLAAVWTHQEQTYSNGNLYGFKNYGWDQLFAAGGAINYCVRWDSTAHVTAAQRDSIHAALQRQYQKWMDQLLDNGQGWNNWPYTQVPVKVVGWAVRDRAQLEWSDTSVDITVGNINENAPQCAPACGRFFHQDGNYNGCPGGAARHYDHSLWLTAGFGGGAGGDWGQRMGSEYFLSNVNASDIHIFLHELGHTYGLDDFYDWDPTPGQGFIMKAGSATQITEFDKWMFRDWWRHLKSRYGR